MDTAGRVEKFKQRYARKPAAPAAATAAAKPAKAAKGKAAAA